jgi:hypothetical protein
MQTPRNTPAQSLQEVYLTLRSEPLVTDAELSAFYNGDQEAQVTDAVVYSLLRSRAVQEFNGSRWFGVHPLVVDILVKQEEIARPQTGGVPGGTE